MKGERGTKKNSFHSSRKTKSEEEERKKGAELAKRGLRPKKGREKGERRLFSPDNVSKGTRWRRRRKKEA